MAAQRLRIDDVARIAVPEQLTIHPSGEQVAFVVRQADLDADVDRQSIWAVGIHTGEPSALTSGLCDSQPAWSPDGTEIAFLREVDGVPQLCCIPAAGGAAESLTELALGAGAPHWSPDGRAIAFVAPVSPSGKSETAPIVADRLDYQNDGLGFRREARRHLHVVDVRSRECRQLTAGDWDVAHPAWSPDGTTIVFAGALEADADLATRRPILAIGAKAELDGAPERVGLERGAAEAIVWTPDGSGLVVVGRTEEGMGHARLLRVDLGDRSIADLAGSLDRNVMPGRPGYPGAVPQFAGDGRTILFCIRDRGCTHLYAVAINGGAPQPLLADHDQSVHSVAVAGQSAAAVLATQTSFGDLVVVDTSAHANSIVRYRGAPADVELFGRERREFAISDGSIVEGWLTRDPGRATPLPLLLDVHGGPHNAWNGTADDVHLYHQELAARGWAVLILNPRGSDGYGEDFYKAVLGAWGRAEVKDLIEPIDTLIDEGVADPAKLAVAGYSYGGYMTCWLTTREPRFAAAVAGGLVCDLASMAGTSDLGHMLGEYEYGGRPWLERDAYAAGSPIAFVESVEAPTLILHGGADMRCPLSQAQQWHTALRERGVPTRLVIYPGSSHLFMRSGRPSHRMDSNRRTVDWLEQWVRKNGE